MNIRHLGRIGASTGVALGLALAFLPAGQAQAATTHVACHDVQGLKDAITQANTDGSGHLYLASGCTYTLTQADTDEDGLPIVTGNVRISSTHRAAVIRRTYSADDFRILHVADGGTLTLDNLVITSGRASAGGGGIYNEGTLTLNHSTVRGNHSGGLGGGVYNYTGRFTMHGGSVRNNSADSDGGGLENFPNSTATISGATISENDSGRYGGGIDNWGTSTLHLTSTSVHGNHAVNGGGISNIDNSTATLTRSTVSDNAASDTGGGIYNYGSSTVHLRHSRVRHNDPDNCAGDSPVPGCVNPTVTRHRAAAQPAAPHKMVARIR